jgi:thiosulfate/3-mercaptopyruvate sulfurtransferase
MSNIISSEKLAEHLNDPDLFIADCRFDLAAPLLGWIQFTEAHIPGAVYVSLDKDLSAPLGPHGGRHPLPPVEEMENRFSEIGMESGKSRVIVYDDAGGSYAARLWWMLRYLGHKHVQVLNGGFQAWLKSGEPVNAEIVRKPQAVFQSKPRNEMLATMEEVRTRSGNCLLVDARANERYRGEIEPIDRIAGHIPGAVNLPWTSNVKTDMTLGSREELLKLYETFPEKTILYCGSGVTSALNVLIMEELGFPLPKLYAGSWSDWISYEENAVATWG